MKGMEELYNKYNPRYVIYTGFQVRVVHSHPDHLQYLLNSNVHINKSDNFEVLKGWIGEGIATSRGNVLVVEIYLFLNNVLPKL